MTAARTVDLLVVGSGVAGLSAAIAGRRAGLDVLVVEREPTWGGTTALSGGGLWMPNNPLMRAAGVDDSVETALAYLDATVGDVGPWTSRARKRAFVETIPEYMRVLAEEGVRWVMATDYPDYYPDLPSGRIGRAVEVAPFDMRRLGAWRRHVRVSVPAPVMTDDVWLLSRAWSSPSGFARGVRLVLRTLGGIARGRMLYGMGGALAASLLYAVRQGGTPVWLRSPMRRLRTDGDRVTGAVVERHGIELEIVARRGVMLAAGGFAQNREWRRRYQGVDGWSSAPLGQQGEGIAAGAEVGGALAMMEDAWWGATAQTVDGGRQHGFILNERSDPWSIVVDQSGRRYLNESESYVDFGHHMLERDRTVPAIPSWLVMDHRHRMRFLNSTLMIPGAAAKLTAAGELVRAATLPDLARAMGVDEQVFLAEVTRFNGFARRGKDDDFGRGDTAYDRYYSSPLARPNPNLGAIERGPFTALKIYPGDLGTKGGLVTDEHARVLREDGSVIEGLYAAGNTTASVMGHTYPGPGSTIGPAGVFGYLGALHAAGR
ncbi:FAD-dependent oxidoreductase [Microbacterium sp. GXF7504]